MPLILRKETPADYSAIQMVTAEAFRQATHTSGTEHLIIAALRDAGELTISLVAEKAGSIVGHVAISPVRISDGTPGWYGLGPIAVAPEWQKQGIGSALVAKALEDLRSSGAAGCVVLGEPEFYERFGFVTAHSLILPNVPPEYFQIINWQNKEPKGSVTFHGAFSVE